MFYGMIECDPIVYENAIFRPLDLVIHGTLLREVVVVYWIRNSLKFGV